MAVQKVAGTTQDGGYGPNTKAAVASWQAAHGLTADGQAESIWGLTPQLQFSWFELATNPNYGLAPLRAASTVYNAVVAFQNDFEGCGTCETDNRVRYADQALAYYG